jgi:hypothetical protein
MTSYQEICDHRRSLGTREPIALVLGRDQRRNQIIAR